MVVVGTIQNARILCSFSQQVLSIIDLLVISKVALLDISRTRQRPAYSPGGQFSVT